MSSFYAWETEDWNNADLLLFDLDAAKAYVEENLERLNINFDDLLSRIITAAIRQNHKDMLDHQLLPLLIKIEAAHPSAPKKISWQEQTWWSEAGPACFDLKIALEFLGLLKSEEEKSDREELVVRIFRASVAQNNMELARSCLTTYGLTAELIMRFRREGNPSIFQLAMESKEASVEWINFLSEECGLESMLNLLDEDNYSALHKAAERGNLSCVQAILKRCPDLYDQRSKYGEVAAVHSAVFYPEVLEYLCAYPSQSVGYMGPYKDPEKLTDLLNSGHLYHRIFGQIRWHSFNKDLAYQSIEILLRYGADLFVAKKNPDGSIGSLPMGIWDTSMFSNWAEIIEQLLRWKNIAPWRIAVERAAREKARGAGGAAGAAASAGSAEDKIVAGLSVVLLDYRMHRGEYSGYVASFLGSSER